MPVKYPTSEDTWPPLPHGTRVFTVKPLANLRGWTAEGLASRVWGVQGTIVDHHDSHGLSYEVEHEIPGDVKNGTIGHYDPDELRVVPEPDPATVAQARKDHDEGNSMTTSELLKDMESWDEP